MLFSGPEIILMDNMFSCTKLRSLGLPDGVRWAQTSSRLLLSEVPYPQDPPDQYISCARWSCEHRGRLWALYCVSETAHLPVTRRLSQSRWEDLIPVSPSPVRASPQQPTRLFSTPSGTRLRGRASRPAVHAASTRFWWLCFPTSTRS